MSEKAEPTWELCGRCRHYHPMGPNQAECRRNPPTAAFAPLATPTIAGAKPRIDWLVQAVRPPVAVGERACGEFQPRAEIVN